MENNIENINIITIEKNIPIPEWRIGGSFSQEKYNFINNMDIGDSFYINGNTPNFKPKGVRSYVYGLNARKEGLYSNWKFTIRTLVGISDEPSAIRVWRMK